MKYEKTYTMMSDKEIREIGKEWNRKVWIHPMYVWELLEMEVAEIQKYDEEK